MALNQILRTRLSESAYIDIHCHKAACNDKLAIVSMDTADFNLDDLNNGFYTLGIHPWFIARQDWRMVLDKIAAVAHHPNLLAIGECGLDKTIDMPMPLQIEVFESQIQLAKRFGKPLIIHCVRVFNELMRIRKTAGTAQPWIIHGFNGNSVLAGQLIRQGCYLSLGKALLQDGGKVRQTLAMMPVERLFLETDAAEDVSIGAIYAAAAKILGLDVSVLKQQILSNFQRVFLHD